MTVTSGSRGDETHLGRSRTPALSARASVFTGFHLHSAVASEGQGRVSSECLWGLDPPTRFLLGTSPCPCAFASPEAPLPAASAGVRQDAALTPAWAFCFWVRSDCPARGLAVPFLWPFLFCPTHSGWVPWLAALLPSSWVSFPVVSLSPVGMALCGFPFCPGSGWVGVRGPGRRLGAPGALRVASLCE